MSFTLLEEVLVNESALGGSSQDAVFTEQPPLNSFIVICYSVNNAGADYDITLPSGFVDSAPQSEGTFRGIGICHKVAGASEPLSYTLSMTGSATLTGIARVFSGQVDEVQPNAVIHEATDTNSISDSLTAAVGSLVVGYLYSSSTAAKGWNAGWETQADNWRTSGVWKESAGGTETATMTLGSGTNNRMSLAMVEFVSASGPTLSTVPETAYPGQSRTITGTGFGPSQGTGSVTLNGVSQTITAWSDTSITFTTVQGNTKHASGYTLEVTTDGDGTADDTIELIVEPGTGGYVDVVDPAVSDESSLAYQFEDAGGNPGATGDQCEWRYTGEVGDPEDVTVQADTLISDLDAEGDLEVRFWDATDSTWGSWGNAHGGSPNR